MTLDKDGYMTFDKPISRFLFDAQYFDWDAKLYYVPNNGWYGPELGKFLNVEHISYSVPRAVRAMSTVACHTPSSSHIATPFTLVKHPTPKREKRKNYTTIESFWGNVHNLQGEDVMICHGVNRFTNTMVGPPNSHANLPGGLQQYVGIKGWYCSICTRDRSLYGSTRRSSC